LRNALAAVALSEGDQAALEEHAGALEGTWAEANSLAERAWWASMEGRLDDARELVQRAVGVRESHGQAEGAAGLSAQLAVVEGLLGDHESAVENARRALAKNRSLVVLIRAALALALAGEAEEADAVIVEMEELLPPSHTFGRALAIPRARAVLAIEAGRPEEAVNALEVSRPWEEGLFRDNAYLRGMALLAAGRAQEAEAQFAEIATIPNNFFWSLQGHLHLLGLARSQAAQGKHDEARASYEALFDAYRDGDPDIPILEKARSEYEALPGVRG
jgi:tetratricopeptide (TPR) repeat protein